MPVIDRFEGHLAVIEMESEMLTVPVDELPEGAREGDVIMQVAGSWVIDSEATEKRKKQATSKLKKLWNEE